MPVSLEMTIRAARVLELSLFIALVVHVLAMLSMAIVLMPAMPGAINTDTARIAYIASYPALWHLGWLPWHLCALSDLLLAIALVKTNWVPKAPVVITLVLTIVAVAIEQPAELMWSLEGTKLAQLSIENKTLATYLDFENVVFPIVGSVAAVIYAFMAYGWTWCFASAGTWSRSLTWLSAITWTLLLLTAAAPLLPVSIRPSLALVGFGNAIGFSLMVLWFILVTEAVLRRSRQPEAHGRMAPWKHPRPDALGQVLSTVGNSRLLRYIGEFVPSFEMVSDIEDVVYINYLVDAERLERLVPEGLELQRLGPDKNYALFSVLTYRHGHFGPSMLGQMRKLLPSPVQSNWRIHVRDHEGVEGIYFVSTVVTNTCVSIGGRMLSDGVPMHVAMKGQVTGNPKDGMEVTLEAGLGSAPDLKARLKSCKTPVLKDAWKECFGTFDNFLAYCVPQDRAISTQPWSCKLTRQEINLGITLCECEPMHGEISSAAIDKIVGTEASAICFRVPKVNFAFKRTIVLPLATK